MIIILTDKYTSIKQRMHSSIFIIMIVVSDQEAITKGEVLEQTGFLIGLQLHQRGLLLTRNHHQSKGKKG